MLSAEPIVQPVHRAVLPPPTVLAPATGLLRLQVFATHLSIHADARADAAIVAIVQRGQTLLASQQKGEWFRLHDFPAAAGRTGWVRRFAIEHGDMSLSVQSVAGGLQPRYEAPRPAFGEAGDIVADLPQSAPHLVGLPTADPASVAPPLALLERQLLPVPDRWRLMQGLGFRYPWYDPYNQNWLKGDLPVLREWGADWFFSLGITSDTLAEFRRVPTPVSPQTSRNRGVTDVFGQPRSFTMAQTVLVSLGLVKGNTTFRPPDYEFRFVPAAQINRGVAGEDRVLFIDPRRGNARSDQHVGVQELFVDKHLRNVSDRYDFDSLRVGIQPFISDFRGFLFQDVPFGVRLFGNRDNNRFQYNLAAFWRLEKDTNSGLNSIVQRPRNDWVFVANGYVQDWPVPSFTSQATIVYNMNREKNRIEVDDNGFPVRPALLGDVRGREYDVVYLGYNGDGHFGRFNLTVSAYGAFGEDRNNFFTSKPAKIRALFAAAELSYDIDWIRLKLSGLYTSGDGKPKDNKETGFSAIFENPIFAGADTSYWIRQTVPFAGGGVNVAISPRNGIINDLRTSKEQGQSNFNNPGTMLLGVGADFDILPQLRFSTNLNHLWFENTATLRELRNEGSIPKTIGWDLSGAIIWRPSMVQNAIFRLSGAVLDPGKGFSDLFTNSRGDDRYYSVLFNAILSF